MSDGRDYGGRGGGPGPGAGGSAGGARNGDFQAAVARLERAVEDLVSNAREQFSDRATTLLDETTRRIERELDRRRQRPRRHSRRRRSGSDDTVRSRRLQRDPERGKIVGVCAGFARYYGVEPWVVRCMAITGLLFFPSIVFPAYWIAYFVMEKRRPENDDPVPERSAQNGRDDTSPAPELGPRLSPRNSLRNVQADLAQVELRLRRMEGHVTSGRYELQRELNRIDGDGDGRSI